MELIKNKIKAKLSDRWITICAILQTIAVACMFYFKPEVNSWTLPVLLTVFLLPLTLHTMKHSFIISNDFLKRPLINTRSHEKYASIIKDNLTVGFFALWGMILWYVFIPENLLKTSVIHWLPIIALVIIISVALSGIRNIFSLHFKKIIQTEKETGELEKRIQALEKQLATRESKNGNE